jgi:hypothetical protein
MTCGADASARERGSGVRARPGRADGPCSWAEQASARGKNAGRARAKQAGPRERERGSSPQEILFFLFQKCKMIFSLFIFVIIYL